MLNLFTLGFIMCLLLTIYSKHPYSFFFFFFLQKQTETEKLKKTLLICIETVKSTVIVQFDYLHLKRYFVLYFTGILSYYYFLWLF